LPQVIEETLNPTWDQTLIIPNVTLFGRAEELRDDPPLIIIELFDKDTVVSDPHNGERYWVLVRGCVYVICHREFAFSNYLSVGAERIRWLRKTLLFHYVFLFGFLARKRVTSCSWPPCVFACYHFLNRTN